jgi:NAD(P)-dependent dehydrogenase (short-subunit alcohol dehydrogenase family)
LARGTDLASLRSVDGACDDVIRSLGSHRIDALALNAGIQTVSNDATSADNGVVMFSAQAQEAEEGRS